MLRIFQTQPSQTTCSRFDVHGIEHYTLHYAYPAASAPWTIAYPLYLMYYPKQGA